MEKLGDSFKNDFLPIFELEIKKIILYQICYVL